MSEASDDLVIVDHVDEGEYTDNDDSVVDPVAKWSDGVDPRSAAVSGGADAARPHAVQIVAIEGAEGSHRFHFRKDLLDSILGGIPSDYSVSVVSVVGAFRTGKSFLLSWFVRFLFGNKSGNNKTSETPWYEHFSSVGNDGFEWKAGSERNTTGIWMWSDAYLDHDRRVATLLVDTQGMFDHETTMNLTASIFGFSTLFSSYLIYNVDKRIQEDHLQQLALFSEYARAAVGSDEAAEVEEGMEELSAVNDGGKAAAAVAASAAPFQHVEFLVRDWQHFEVGDEEDDDDLDRVDYEALEGSMAEYLSKVLEERVAKDLQETREQINTCFDEVTCYGLCHPGFEVTKKKYAGDVSAVEPLFLRLLDRYCHHVFESARPKTIHGRTLTVAELTAYVQAYASLFADGSKFPTAATLLAATSQANNTNALQLALSSYQHVMDRVSGPKCSSYLKPEELRQEHQRAVEMSLEHFDSIATFGSRSNIHDVRETLVNKLLEKCEVYTSLNEGRNPLAGLETYV
jgi:atlastin